MQRDEKNTGRCIAAVCDCRSAPVGGALDAASNGDVGPVPAAKIRGEEGDFAVVMMAIDDDELGKDKFDSTACNDVDIATEAAQAPKEAAEVRMGTSALKSCWELVDSAIQ